MEDFFDRRHVHDLQQATLTTLREVQRVSLGGTPRLGLRRVVARKRLAAEVMYGEQISGLATPAAISFHRVGLRRDDHGMLLERAPPERVTAGACVLE